MKDSKNNKISVNLFTFRLMSLETEAQCKFLLFFIKKNCRRNEKIEWIFAVKEENNLEKWKFSLEKTKLEKSGGREAIFGETIYIKITLNED